MSEAVTPDPYADPLRFGQRTQILRERRGMTQAQLAGLIGISSLTLRKIENGQQKAPALDMVLRIAEALRVRNLADLTGRPDAQVDLFVGPGHPRLATADESLTQITNPLDLYFSSRGEAGPRRVTAVGGQSRVVLAPTLPGSMVRGSTALASGTS